MSPRVLWHYFPKPVPYQHGLELQELVHQHQLLKRRAGQLVPNILLLLQHRPVYTTGRRQDVVALDEERNRLRRLGADWVPTNRGGETTYHGLGQIVGYPLLDLSQFSKLSVRDYICHLQIIMKGLAFDYNIPSISSQHTGVFTSHTQKLGSIGVQVRHRLTSHGFALNVSSEPMSWFQQVVACGLADVNAVSISSHTGKDVGVHDVIPKIVERFGSEFKATLEPLSEKEPELFDAIANVEKESTSLPPPPTRPVTSDLTS